MIEGPSVTVEAKTLEGLSLKIKNLALAMGFEKGEFEPEDDAPSKYKITIVGNDSEDLKQNVYNLRAVFGG